MQCERAQEFFSDHLETTLERPMAVALEAHLGACSACRDDYDALRIAWRSLSTLPEVVPPADGARQVVLQLRQLRAEQQEAARTPAFSMLDWLRALSPMRVAMGAGLATLVIVGAVSVPWIPHTTWGFLPHGGGRSPATAAAGGAAQSSLQVTYGPLTARGQQITLRLVPGSPLLKAHVRLKGGPINYAWAIDTALGPNRPLDVPVHLPAGAGEVLRLTAESSSSTARHEFLVALPAHRRPGGAVTQIFAGQSLEEGLRRLAPSLDRPLIVEASADPAVSVTVDGASPAEAVQALAESGGYDVQADADAYRLTLRR